MQHLIEGLRLLGWAIMWSAGGILLGMSTFKLRRNEVAIVGLALGLVLEIWVANLLAQVLSIALAVWLAPVTILAVGMAARAFNGDWRAPAVQPWSWIALAGLTLLFTGIGRGLGVFDDYQNLPTVSLMAAGDVPPHFALDPSLQFGYHYLLLLLASQLMRLGSLLPWSALDVARGFVLALPLVLVAHWAHRLTRNWLAACLSSTVLALAGGARWLLLLFPPSWLKAISTQVTLIGSASTSAPSLAEAMISPWKIDGGGPIPFPFAFYSGVNQPYIMLYTGIAGSGVLIILLLLLTANRWRNKGAAVITVALLAALAMANEIAFLLLGLGILIAALSAFLGGKKSIRPGIISWLTVCAAAFVVAALQGGMVTEIIRHLIRPTIATRSYFDPTPMLVWPPSIVSAHMGSLSTARPSQLLVALLEIGPIVLVTPAVLARGWRLLGRGRWLEAGLIGSSAGLLGALFLSFRGPLFTAAPRLLGGWLLVCSLYFVPLAWTLVRARGDGWRVGAGLVGAVACIGGLVLFAVQLAAIQRPVYSTFITELDARMTERQWNRVAADALVFDPLVYRAPTVLGRPTRSSLSWYERSREWELLRDGADPRAIRAAGLGYMYLDGQYWEQLSADQQAALEQTCVKTIDRVDGVRNESDYTKDFRVLLDVRACR